MDFTVITDAVDWAGVLTGMGVVAAALAGVAVARKGARMLIDFLR
jgi:hypothetical protein